MEKNAKQYKVNHNKYCKRLGNWTERSNRIGEEMREKDGNKNKVYGKGVLLLNFFSRKVNSGNHFDF